VKLIISFKIADIFRRHGQGYTRAHAAHLGRVERRVMSAITACRTAALGAHVEACDDCALEAWLREQRERVSTKSEIAKAINYSLNRWLSFTRFSSTTDASLPTRRESRAPFFFCEEQLS
jgi:hypothetical protein